jgi:hypothetical protein
MIHGLLSTLIALIEVNNNGGSRHHRGSFRHGIQPQRDKDGFGLSLGGWWLLRSIWVVLWPPDFRDGRKSGWLTPLTGVREGGRCVEMPTAAYV